MSTVYSSDATSSKEGPNEQNIQAYSVQIFDNHFEVLVSPAASFILQVEMKFKHFRTNKKLIVERSGAIFETGNFPSASCLLT